MAATNGIILQSSSSPVVQKCKRIQQELLRRSDPELYEYLTEMDMEPQLYALYVPFCINVIFGSHKSF